MNFFVNILLFLKSEMSTPKPFGWFHITCILIMLFTLLLLYKKRFKYGEEQLKLVIGIYSIIALILEALKQLIWSFNYDSITNLITWDYQWYAFPFQFCTTPIFVCIICLFLKKNKLRDSLLSYICFYTILGSFLTMILPNSCFTSDILVNIHTMWLHLGSFVISIYLLINNEVKILKDNFKNSTIVFIIFVLIAQLLNIIVYNSSLLNGEEFNMFYISPYFISSLPVFNTLQELLPYFIYLFVYIISVILGANIVYYINYFIRKRKS